MMFLVGRTNSEYLESSHLGRCLVQEPSLARARCNFLEMLAMLAEVFYLSTDGTCVSGVVVFIRVNKGVKVVFIWRRSNLMWMLADIQVSFLAITKTFIIFRLTGVSLHDCRGQLVYLVAAEFDCFITRLVFVGSEAID